MKKLTSQYAQGWIGVDLDGTLAHVDHAKPYDHTSIGAPVPLMLARVKQWIAAGRRVKIFTARVAHSDKRDEVTHTIHRWCTEHGLGFLEVTATKDGLMYELWDDRAIGVLKNTGLRADGVIEPYPAPVPA